MANLDTRGFYPDNTPNPAMENIAKMLERQKERKYEIDYRRHKDEEAQNWRRLNYIQDATDLSKHPTGDSAAQDITNKKVLEVLKKYTSPDAKKMDDAAVVYGVQQDMANVISNSDRIHEELTRADEEIKGVKQLFPNLDIESIRKAKRADIVQRHLDGKGDFNPEVSPSEFNLADINTLSKFVPKTKEGMAITSKLDEAIRNPKGLEPEEALTGNSYSHVNFKARIPTWMQRNFGTEDLKKGGGYLPRSFVPELSIKAEPLPSDFLPNLKGSQRLMVTPDVHMDFMSEHPVEIIAGTRGMFPDYDSFNDGEKHLAERDYLYQKIKSLDQSRYYPVSGTHAPVSHNTINMGGVSTINDVYPRIIKAMDSPDNAINQAGKRIGTLMNSLDSESQRLIFDAFGGRKDDLNEKNTFLAYKDGTPVLYRTNQDGQPQIGREYEVGAIPKSIDVKAQPNVGTKLERLKQIEAEKNKKPTENKIIIKGLKKG